MNIALSRKTQTLLEQKLRTGQYRSEDEVLCAALEALDQVEASVLDEQTRAAIDRAEDQIERGEVHDWQDVRAQVQAKFLGKD